jgi:hypothetical protein
VLSPVELGAAVVSVAGAAALAAALADALADALGAALAVGAVAAAVTTGGSVVAAVGGVVGATMTIAVLDGANASFVVATSDEPCLRMSKTARTTAATIPNAQNASSKRRSRFCSV